MAIGKIGNYGSDIQLYGSEATKSKYTIIGNQFMDSYQEGLNYRPEIDIRSNDCQGEVTIVGNIYDNTVQYHRLNINRDKTTIAGESTSSYPDPM